MSKPAIIIEDLWKEYIIGGQEKGYKTFREAIVDTFSAPFKRFQKLSGQVAEEQRFWALQEINFEVQPGEVVGIIGRNGAGKSTLLKILSRITEPTKGKIEIRGRVSSLLEVGTGFHPELTGRENIYLNGAILGMSRAEINQKFDEIVDFSGIEKFIDTPVKRYSTGMQVRLAFAVAAHLEPEILIVDEVLAVGDFKFQKKCLGKMEEVSTKEGKTILFVSHNMSAVSKLCSRAIALSQGNIWADGKTSQVITQYLQSATGMQDNDNEIIFEDKHKTAQIKRIVFDRTKIEQKFYQFEIEYFLREDLFNYRLGIEIFSPDAQLIFSSASSELSPLYTDPKGLYRKYVKFDFDLLNAGTYLVSAFIGQPSIKRHDTTTEYLKITIETGLAEKQGIIGKLLLWTEDSI